MARSIFYSWQSDSPPKSNRYFIRGCLLEVLKRLSKDENLEEAIRLDQDTEGIPGTPDIANTIFQKIRDACIFVADLTLSSEAESGKRLPNPNVLIELGYALSAISDSRVVLIMNTAFGGADQLPFDLSHKRWPVRYSFSTTDVEDKVKREAIKKNLTDSLYSAIRLILETVSPLPDTQLRLTGAPSLQYVERCIWLTDPQEGWKQSGTDTLSVAVNKSDVNLRLAVNYLEEGQQCRDFKAEWANRHSEGVVRSFV